MKKKLLLIMLLICSSFILGACGTFEKSDSSTKEVSNEDDDDDVKDKKDKKEKKDKKDKKEKSEDEDIDDDLGYIDDEDNNIAAFGDLTYEEVFGMSKEEFLAEQEKLEEERVAWEKERDELDKAYQEAINRTYTEFDEPFNGINVSYDGTVPVQVIIGPEIMILYDENDTHVYVSVYGKDDLDKETYKKIIEAGNKGEDKNGNIHYMLDAKDKKTIFYAYEDSDIIVFIMYDNKDILNGVSFYID